MNKSRTEKRTTRNITYGLMIIMMLALFWMPASAQYSTTLTDQPNIRATLLSQTPDPVAPGRYVELRFRIENLGLSTTDDMLFELVTEYPFSLNPGDSPIRELGSFYGRATGDKAATLYYKLRIDNDAVDGDNTIRLRYSTDEGDNWEYFNDFTIRVQSDASQVGISSVVSEPERFVPGQETMATLTISNMGDSFIQDVAVKLDLSSTSTPFAPINSATEKKVKTIGAGKSAELSFNLITIGDATSSIYKVPVSITYSDATGASHTKNDYISLIVGTEPDIVVLLDSQTFHSSGARGDITVKFVNKGVTDAKFLNLEVKPSEDFELLSPAIVYLGKLDSDDFETADFTLYAKPTSEDYLVVPLSVDYTDANNQAYHQDVELKVRLYSSAELKRYGFSGGSPLVGIIIILLIVGGGYYIYRRRKKAKK